MGGGARGAPAPLNVSAPVPERPGADSSGWAGPPGRSHSLGLGLRRSQHRAKRGQGRGRRGWGDGEGLLAKHTWSHMVVQCPQRNEAEQREGRARTGAPPTLARMRVAAAPRGPPASARAPWRRCQRGDHAAAASAWGTELTRALSSPAFRHFRNASAFPGTRARSHLRGRPDFPGRGRAGGRKEEGGAAQQAPGPTPVAAAEAAPCALSRGHSPAD